jgi:hypothetical protein
MFLLKYEPKFFYIVTMDFMFQRLKRAAESLMFRVYKTEILKHTKL